MTGKLIIQMALRELQKKSIELEKELKYFNNIIDELIKADMEGIS